MSSVEYIESLPLEDLQRYIDPEIALVVPQSVSTDIDDSIPYAIDSLFEIPSGFNSFSHFSKPYGCKPKELFRAYVFSQTKIEEATLKLDELDLEEEAIQEALFLLKMFNEMHREVKTRMSEILGG